MKKIIFLIILFLNLNFTNSYSNNELYEKIDLFGEVLETIEKDYVDDVNQPKMMDSAINGVLQSLDPYSAYMSPELFKEMQTDTRGEFGGLGIEIGMESGLVKVISPIDDTPAAMAGINIMISIGAPTSLAIDLAVACSITLVGFVSGKGYNIYSCEQRILSTIN